MAGSGFPFFLFRPSPREGTSTDAAGFSKESARRSASRETPVRGTREPHERLLRGAQPVLHANPLHAQVLRERAARQLAPRAAPFGVAHDAVHVAEGARWPGHL